MLGNARSDIGIYMYIPSQMMEILLVLVTFVPVLCL